MLYQGPEGYSTPGNPVLPCRQVNVLAIYVESIHEYWLSDPTAVTRGADWLDLNTFPPAEYALPRTIRLLNTWNTGFVITASQCSGHLYRIKPRKQTFWCYCSHMRGWLSRHEHLSTCGISSTNDQKAPQHLEKQVLPLCQFTVMAIYNESNHEWRLYEFMSLYWFMETCSD